MIDNNKCLLNSKSAYQNDFWRIMWHWRLDRIHSFYTNNNYVIYTVYYFRVDFPQKKFDKSPCAYRQISKLLYLISFISKLLIISKSPVHSYSAEPVWNVALCWSLSHQLAVCLIWSPSLLCRLTHLWFHAELCPVWVCSLCLRVCAGLRYTSVRVSVCVRAESRLVAGLRRWLVSTFTQEGGPFVGSLWWPGSRPRLVLLPESRERSNVSDRERQTGKRDGAPRSCR